MYVNIKFWWSNMDYIRWLPYIIQMTRQKALMKYQA